MNQMTGEQTAHGAREADVSEVRPQHQNWPQPSAEIPGRIDAGTLALEAQQEAAQARESLCRRRQAERVRFQGD